jgi:YHS domain-containing protein
MVVLILGAAAVAVWGAEPAKVGLEGYCPVCILKMKAWVRGSPQHQATYDGITYRFPSDKGKQMFLADPASFVPALGGDCTVCWAKMGKRVPGNIRHAVFHGKRLYLFTSEKQKEAFRGNPAPFANVDLALDGNCAVCLAHMGKPVPGRPEFTAIHRGLRYLFPSDRERQAFLANPDKYAEKPRGARVTPASLTRQLITVEGRSGCAGCEHGVTPIGASDTLGLAVNTPDGHVYVVEDAHQLYPKLYKDRFSGQQLRVSGEILRQKGKITWVRPKELNVVN